MKFKLTNFTKKYFRLIVQIMFFSCLIFNFEYGIIIWGIFTILSIFLGRIYCGFFCTIGVYQDWIGNLGEKIFKNRFDTLIPRKISNVLSYFRYVVMITWAFFATSFFTTHIMGKIGSPSPDAIVNLAFSREIVGVAVIISFCIFTVLSLLVRRPYCKYFCHGSVEAGALSFARVIKLKRNPELCINCHRCEKICPMNVPITSLETVCDGSCISCFQCIGSKGCPKKGALYLDVKPLKNIFKRNRTVFEENLKIKKINKSI